MVSVYVDCPGADREGARRACPLTPGRVRSSNESARIPGSQRARNASGGVIPLPGVLLRITILKSEHMPFPARCFLGHMDEQARRFGMKSTSATFFRETIPTGFVSIWHFLANGKGVLMGKHLVERNI